MMDLNDGHFLVLGPDVAEDHPDRESAERRLKQIQGQPGQKEFPTDPADYKPRRSGQKRGALAAAFPLL